MSSQSGRIQRQGMPGRSAALFIVSDGGGATADAAVNAATAQFPGVAFRVNRRPGIRTREQVLRVVREASASEAIVVHTIVVQDLRNLLVRECRLRLIPHVDLIGPLIGYIEQEVGRKPILQPGVSQAPTDEYFKRIDAIQFTVQHDDGQSIDDLDQADCVLVGVSRTSKTPLSIYLSMRGWRVANVPIILGVDPPPILEQIEQQKIVALTIEANHLERIRRARLESLDQLTDGEYADPDKIREEIAHFRRIVRRGYPWPIIDITGKSIEESAKEIIAIFESFRQTSDLSRSGRIPREIVAPKRFEP
jgi:[pyruvate, water dikinase]-phosphate phosphotransferase / [pyruvate, water dikinase] kinase